MPEHCELLAECGIGAVMNVATSDVKTGEEFYKISTVQHYLGIDSEDELLTQFFTTILNR
jgi:hypothetical protein